MLFGVGIPHRGPLARADAIRAVAAAAESLGFGYLTVSDHIFVPRKIASTYPYSETGEFPGSSTGESMEQFSLLAWLAGVTTRPRLLTSVTVLPHRRPEFMAKAIATIDQLSGGRVTMGCGVGWMREEFEAIGAPPFDERGKVADEYIAAMKAIWTEKEPAYHGRFVDFADVDVEPRPRQEPHPPIWIGGESPAARRRAVRLADGWYPFGSNPRFRFDTLATFEAGLADVRRLCEAAGRDPATLAVAYNAPFHDETRREHKDGGRLMLTGSAGERTEDIRALAALGVGTIVPNLTAATVPEAVARMSRFAAEVMPLVKG
jgi:probable F420-dependent oxidoreductase